MVIVLPEKTPTDEIINSNKAAIITAKDIFLKNDLLIFNDNKGKTTDSNNKHNPIWKNSVDIILVASLFNEEKII